MFLTTTTTRKKILILLLILLLFLQNFFSDMNRKIIWSFGNHSINVLMFENLFSKGPACFVYFSSKNTCLSFLKTWMSVGKKQESQCNLTENTQITRYLWLPTECHQITGWRSTKPFLCGMEDTKDIASILNSLLQNFSSKILPGCK